jgi:hypothetical protein
MARIKILNLEHNVQETLNQAIDKGWEIISVLPQFGFDTDGILVSTYYVVHLRHPTKTPFSPVASKNEK